MFTFKGEGEKNCRWLRTMRNCALKFSATDVALVKILKGRAEYVLYDTMVEK